LPVSGRLGVFVDLASTVTTTATRWQKEVFFTGGSHRRKWNQQSTL